MNVVFFMQDSGAVFGAERATIDLADGLRQAGDNPHFFLIREARLASTGSLLVEAIKSRGYPVCLFDVSGRFSVPMALRVRKAFHAMPDAVLHVVGYKANLHARLAGIRPVVATVHGWLFRADFKERFYGAIDRWCLRHCDRVVCLSAFYERMLLEYKVPRDRLLRIPSGISDIPDLASIGTSGHSRENVTFGMMGRFSEEKNHAAFLRAAKRVSETDPTIRFVIAGQGPLEAELRALADRLALRSTVRFTGYSTVSEFMSLIDAYVICSRIENLPNSILEAMAWSKPVIGTSVGGIPDLVVDGTTGRLVPPDDDTALAAAMLEMAADVDRMSRMGQSGRDRLQESFTLARSVAMHQEMYRSLPT